MKVLLKGHPDWICPFLTHLMIMAREGKTKRHGRVSWTFSKVLMNETCYMCPALLFRYACTRRKEVQMNY